MNENDYGFTEWPLNEVPIERTAGSLWADRSKTRRQIDAVFYDWTIRRGSMIHLLWADLGAGKTHTLLNIKARCLDRPDMVPLLVLLPAAVGNFVGLYRAIASEIDWHSVARNIIDGGPQLRGSDLWNALFWLYQTADTRKALYARQWLLGDKLTPTRRELLNIASGITTQDEAVEVLKQSLPFVAGDKKRLVLMIDEYQRVAEGSRRTLQDTGHAIHTIYNAMSERLSLVLSCATGGADDYQNLLTPEIVSRLSPKRIELDYLTPDDAITFIADTFKFYRSPDVDVDALYPLTQSVTSKYAHYIADKLGGDLTPRRLIKAFHELLSDVSRESMNVPLSDAAFDDWLGARGESLLAIVSE